MLTRQEREQAVLDLYNQGKTIREISKEIRMSFRDIGAVLKKEEKEKERKKRQLDNNSSTYSDSTQNGVSLSTQAHKLFSQGKTPLEVAIELDLSEKKVTKYYKEYWKLKGLYMLNLIHDEIKDDIIDFAKLYRLSKASGKTAEHVVNLLNIANNDLFALENKHEKLQQNVNHLESKDLDFSISLEDLKSQIQDTNQSLDSCRLSYQKEVDRTLQFAQTEYGTW
jgi:DNA-binding CsgD family transcriptional regulator/Txe/YoeB family toxin of Txe-Axe toxin-antitoxin module